MFATQFADLTTGYERFDALKKNLEGIFDKIYQMKEYKLDISYYEAKFEEFKKEFKLADDFLQSSKMPFEEMQKDYEGFTLTECNKKLEKLTMEFEENVTPIYNIYLLLTRIDEKLYDENDDDIDDVIKQTILLIDQLNGIYTHNKIEVTRLIDKAYEVIFNSLLYEKVYGRKDILNYISQKNLSTNRENLGKVLRDHVNELMAERRLDRKEVDEELLQHLDEGLGYDYLSEEFLGTLSRKLMTSKHRQINYRKQQMSDYVTDAIRENNKSYTSLVRKMDDSKTKMSAYRRARVKVAAKAAAIILAPLIALGAGLGGGRLLSNNIDEYATITRSVNMETGAIVSEPVKVYDEKATSYVATITVYDPWRKSPTGMGYIRNAVAYEYIVPENVEDGYHVTIEDIEGNLREKYRFNEPKQELSPEDSMTESEIVVTETYQDKNDSRKSSKYVLPFGIGAFILTLVGEGFLLYFNEYSISDLFNELDNAYEDVKRGKKTKKELLEEMKAIKGRLDSIKADKQKIEAEYGITIDDKLLEEPKPVAEIDYAELFKQSQPQEVSHGRRF
ncbi:MAG: hypothetical protein II625_04485 [Bacilli bacterium]|nr:hypothetical protein [Bacilli bacterium]